MSYAFMRFATQCKKAIIAATVGLVAVAATTPASANPKYAAFVYDANRGKVLFARNADAPRYPASLTKMMTLYMVFDAIDAKKITLNTRMKVSKRASSMPPSKLGLRTGSTIRVRDAILALVTKSANDVATVIAEHLGGTESNFAAMMTRKARSIGMSKTTFANASGLPNSRQKTTARDMARLSLAIRTYHPKSFNYFKTRSFRYGKRVYSNHNRLLGRVRGVNGIKTGYIRASGFNLATNVETGGRHMVAIVMGGRTARARNAHMTTLVNRYIRKVSRKKWRAKATPLIKRPGKRKAKPIIVAAKPKPAALAKASVAPLPVPKTAATAPQPKSNPVVVAANTVTDNAIEQGSQGDPKKPVAATKPAPVTTAKQFDGWKIQISASPTLAKAQELLLEASKKGAAVLSSKKPYTEPVEKDGSTLYRVRFAGFADQASARRACVYMKRKKYRCIFLNS